MCVFLLCVPFFSATTIAPKHILGCSATQTVSPNVSAFPKFLLFIYIDLYVVFGIVLMIVSRLHFDSFSLSFSPYFPFFESARMAVELRNSAKKNFVNENNERKSIRLRTFLCVSVFVSVCVSMLFCRNAYTLHSVLLCLLFRWYCLLPQHKTTWSGGRIFMCKLFCKLKHAVIRRDLFVMIGTFGFFTSSLSSSKAHTTFRWSCVYRVYVRAKSSNIFEISNRCDLINFWCIKLCVFVCDLANLCGIFLLSACTFFSLIFTFFFFLEKLFNEWVLWNLNSKFQKKPNVNQVKRSQKLLDVE